MEYYDIRHTDIKVNLYRAITSCVAQDEGLYLPASLPKVPHAFVQNLKDMTLREIAYATTNVFLGEDVDSATIKKIIDNSLNFDTPMVRLSDNRYVLELFHGPTGVFKDIGARFLSGLYDAILPLGEKLNLLVATNGNTGMAIANAFAGKSNVNVFVLAPHGAMSRQEFAKLESLGKNINAVEVGGDIDACKSMVTSAFADVKLRETLLLGSANSINFARLIPQVAIYFYAAGCLAADGVASSNVDFAVPSGNLGMLTSGYIAKKMGLGIGKMIGACNVNDTFDRYLHTGRLEPRKTIVTHAKMMDMSLPSNLPRLQALAENDIEKLRDEISSVAINDELIEKTIKDNQAAYGYLADPHAAVAMAALNRRENSERPGVAFATAHPSRSAKLLSRLTGIEVVATAPVANVSSQAPDRLPPTYPALRKYLLSHQ